MSPELPPIRRSVAVSWDQAAAFRRFTQEFATWWPWRTHSIGGARVRRVGLECRPGGLIQEGHTDGRRFPWGVVRDFEPPHRVSFSWRPSRDASTAQEVELRFVPFAGGTRVDLVSDKWENWGRNAQRARRRRDRGHHRRVLAMSPFRLGRRLFSSAALLMILVAAAHTAGHMPLLAPDAPLPGVLAAMADDRNPLGLGMSPSLLDIHLALVLTMSVTLLAGLRATRPASQILSQSQIASRSSCGTA